VRLKNSGKVAVIGQRGRLGYGYEVIAGHCPRRLFEKRTGCEKRD
jgi:hypothetical protein